MAIIGQCLDATTNDPRTALDAAGGLGPGGILSFHSALFRFLYSRSLVYNTCWEDPAVDRQALRLGRDDRVLVITSAGCNALDYALEEPAHIVAVDSNPRQTALLELKLAAIRHLSFEDMFALFGRGWHPDFPTLYRGALRPDLCPFAREFWDAHGHWFSRRGGTLYTHGLSGLVARAVQWRLAASPALGEAARALFDQPDLESQRRHYLAEVRPRFWTPLFPAAPFHALRNLAARRSPPAAPPRAGAQSEERF